MRIPLIFSIFQLIILPLFLNAQSNYPTNWDYYTQLELRRQVIISAISGQTGMKGEDPRKRVYLGVVKIFTGIDRATGVQYLWEAVNDTNHWGSFNVYSIMDAVLRIGDQLPPEMVEKTRSQLAANFGEDKGFTENHKLQYRTARYLFDQTWPDGPNFTDGSTPGQGMKEAENWINDWIDRTVTVGQMEFDSVNYHSLYLLCMTTLYDFARDPLMKRKAWMMMQLLLADWAPEYLKGNWIGAHSREKFNQVTHTVLNCGTAIPFGYLFFGDSRFHPGLEETYYVGLAAVQGFRPLAIIGNIATDRSMPYVHRETKAPRRGFGINTSDLPTGKYDYVTKDYALGSSYGDLTAVENHRWDLTWVSERDGSTCFFINPSYSAEQLLKYFDDDPDKILNNIIQQRPYYKDPNKWIEGSPYEQLLQHENTIFARYDIPEHERNGHVNGFFPKIIDERIQDGSGWIFCRVDSIYFAVLILTEREWHEEQDHFRVTINNRRTGIIMEVAQQSDYASFQAFQDSIRGNYLFIDMKKLHVIYTNSHGNRLDFEYPDKRSVNGKKIKFMDWELFEGPFVNSKKGSKVFAIQHQNKTVILDFNDYSVKLCPISN